MTKQDPYPNPPYHIYQPTLEERVERLEKRMRASQWVHEIDWNGIAHDGVMLILSVLLFVLILVKF